MTYYIMLAISALLLALNFSVTKIYQKKRGTSLRAGLIFTALTGLCAVVIYLVVVGFQVEFTPFSFAMAAVAALTVQFYTLLSFRVLQKGSMARYTLFLMTGGMIVPYIWGVLFLGEELSLLRTVGLIVMTFSVVLANYTKEKLDWKLLLMYLAIFLLNGFASVSVKVHQVETVLPVIGSDQFVLWNNIVRFGVSALILLVLMLVKRPAPAQPDTDASAPTSRKTVLLIALLVAGSSVLNAVIGFLQVYSALYVPATALYPFVTGGTIIFTSLAGFLFKEKLSKRMWLSIALCFFSTLTFL
ncbi:MAG: hypothetical protein IJY82_05905 [Oscillospiraceae bacterium]|nr:hypothetical protein [Oscillospiraceae bacterium]